MEILYIEDDLIDQLVLKRIVKRKNGVACQIANDLQEAEALVQTGSFDLILSDYYLAADTIEDVLLKFSNYPIFLISGSDNPPKVKKLYDRGLKGHFIKPFLEEYLENIINRKIISPTPTSSLAKSAVDFTLPVIFNFSYLNKISADSLTMKIELIKIFIDLGSQEKALIEKALTERDWKLIGLATHKLKSNFNMMGLKQLLRKADELELVSRSENAATVIPHELPSFIKRLELAIQIAKMKLAEFTIS